MIHACSPKQKPACHPPGKRDTERLPSHATLLLTCRAGSATGLAPGSAAACAAGFGGGEGVPPRRRGWRSKTHRQRPEVERIYGESQAKRIERIVDRWQSAIAMIHSHVEQARSGARTVGTPDSDGFLEPGGRPPHGRTVQQPIQTQMHASAMARPGCTDQTSRCNGSEMRGRVRWDNPASLRLRLDSTRFDSPHWLGNYFATPWQLPIYSILLAKQGSRDSMNPATILHANAGSRD
ncbi:hypothetical protein J3F83DRAFT_494157 [Trichoderma novae-zelandiae]